VLHPAHSAAGEECSCPGMPVWATLALCCSEARVVQRGARQDVHRHLVEVGGVVNRHWGQVVLVLSVLAAHSGGAGWQSCGQ
jgi:hypothetical protein